MLFLIIDIIQVTTLLAGEEIPTAVTEMCGYFGTGQQFMTVLALLCVGFAALHLNATYSG